MNPVTAATADCARFEHEAHSEAVNTHIVAYGAKIPDAASNKGGDEVFRDATKAETTDHPMHMATASHRRSNASVAGQKDSYSGSSER